MKRVEFKLPPGFEPTPAAMAFMESFHAVIREETENLELWVEALLEGGVAAAHPDDGWVDRASNEFQLMYPYFRREVRPGDTVALGDHRKFRLVRVTGIRHSMLFPEITYFKFEGYDARQQPKAGAS